MKGGFPKRSKSQRTGAGGLLIVEKIVHDELGWIFRTNHQEHDFGIDGYIDVVRIDGAVLGRSVAVQVKTGKSHIAKETPAGFVLRGNRKHLNYFLNYPLPVILLLIDKESKSGWWVHVRPQAIRMTKTGREITVPRSQVFDSSNAAKLKALAGDVVDYGPLLEKMTMIRTASRDAAIVVFLVSRGEIEDCNTARLKEYFAMFEASPDHLSDIRNKVTLVVHGYTDDVRELYEIQEVRAWFHAAEKAVVGWPYYWALVSPGGPVFLFYYCTSKIKVIGRSTDQKKMHLETSGREVSKFLKRHFASLNHLVEKHGISEAINEEISRALTKFLIAHTGIDTPG